jgi:hypothetical protein
MYYELDDYVKDSYTAKYGSGVERREAILRKSLYKSEKDDLEEIFFSKQNRFYIKEAVLFISLKFSLSSLPL